MRRLATLRKDLPTAYKILGAAARVRRLNTLPNSALTQFSSHPQSPTSFGNLHHKGHVAFVVRSVQPLSSLLICHKLTRSLTNGRYVTTVAIIHQPAPISSPCHDCRNHSPTRAYQQPPGRLRNIRRAAQRVSGGTRSPMSC